MLNASEVDLKPREARILAEVYVHYFLTQLKRFFLVVSKIIFKFTVDSWGDVSCIAVEEL